jgi:putative oxidoreductase
MPTSKTIQLQAWGITLLRLVTGIVFLTSGAQHLFHPELGPVFIAGSLVALLCGAALVVGLLTRWVCIPLVFLMLVDIFVYHPPSLGDDEFNYASLRLAASAALALAGPGKMALDNVLAGRRGGPKQG